MRAYAAVAIFAVVIWGPHIPLNLVVISLYMIVVGAVGPGEPILDPKTAFEATQLHQGAFAGGAQVLRQQQQQLLLLRR